MALVFTPCSYFVWRWEASSPLFSFSFLNKFWINRERSQWEERQSEIGIGNGYSRSENRKRREREEKGLPEPLRTSSDIVAIASHSISVAHLSLCIVISRPFLSVCIYSWWNLFRWVHPNLTRMDSPSHSCLWTWTIVPQQRYQPLINSWNSNEMPPQQLNLAPLGHKFRWKMEWCWHGFDWAYRVVSFFLLCSSFSPRKTMLREKKEEWRNGWVGTCCLVYGDPIPFSAVLCQSQFGERKKGIGESWESAESASFRQAMGRDKGVNYLSGLWIIDGRGRLLKRWFGIDLWSLIFCSMDISSSRVSWTSLTREIQWLSPSQSSSLECSKRVRNVWRWHNWKDNRCKKPR